MNDASYMMGRTDHETRRLMSVARMVNPSTRRMLLDAGLSEGMRVLDVGTGAGDVAIVAAKIIGPSGSVVAVDQNAAILRTAEERARAEGLKTITFVAGAVDDVELVGPFDAIVGRFVLMYVPHAADLLRRLATRLAPGGIVAFQDINLTPESSQTIPTIALWRTAWTWAITAAAQAGIPAAGGFELYRTMTNAGLPTPTSRLESIVEGGPTAVSYDWMADTLRSMLPFIERFNIATAGEMDLDTLADRLRAESLAANAVIKTPDVVAAWTRLP